MPQWIFATDAFLRFFGPFQPVLQAFLKLREAAVHGFSGFFKKILKKNSVMESTSITVGKRRI